MGLFGDLFKNRNDWTAEELQALWQAMSAMAGADGNVDDNENAMIVRAMQNLPGYKVSNWDDFANSVANMKPEESFKIMKNMHTEKRKLCIALLHALANSDGNIDDNEATFFMNMSKLLGITPDSFKN